MDQRLLRHYNRELQHLREMGGEFAQEFPKIAGRLGVEELECSDPYVERLMEGFAFMAARVQLQMEAEFPRFTQYLFETFHPHYLCPVPSMAMVQLQPDESQGSLSEGPVVPRGSELRSNLGNGQKTRCIYTTAHDVQLWPLQITHAEYHTRDLASLGINVDTRARAALRLRLQSTDGSDLTELPIEKLTLHLGSTSHTAMKIYEQLFAHTLDVIIHAPTRPPEFQRQIGRDAIEQVGFLEDESLLPYDPRSFQGYRLLQEYFAFPKRFMFFAINQLQQALPQAAGTTVDITIIFDTVDEDLEGDVDASDFSLFCTPAINLFEKRLDRIHLSDRFSEFHVVSDRTAPLDYEVHSILKVTGFGTRGTSDEQEFDSFYRARDTLPGVMRSAYFASHRIPRTLNQNELRGRRRSTSYSGSEVYISLVDSNAAPYSTDLRQLGITARCTNRDLPLQMPIGRGVSDFTLESGAPVAAIKCLGSPTPPMPSHAEGEFAWRLISHLTPNYLSLSDANAKHSPRDHHDDAATAFRDILTLYADTSQPELRKQIEALRDIKTEPIIRRIGRNGPASFARGLKVNVSLDETGFEGVGMFVFGAVLERFFARYVTLNVFTTTEIRSTQRGKVKEWPIRTGNLQNF